MSVWQTREVKLRQPHTELRLLPASRRFHKARKQAVLGSSDREAASGRTQGRFLVTGSTSALAHLVCDERHRPPARSEGTERFPF